MLQLNAGAALIDQMVADTITEMTVSADGEEDEVMEWIDEVFYLDILEQTARSYFANGYAVQQPIRQLTPEGNENTYTVINIDAETWYPQVPTFKYQKIQEGRVVSVFPVTEDDSKNWYAFVEHHTQGTVEHKLYRLENSTDLEGKEVPLDSLSRFEGVNDSVATDLDYLPLFQIDRTKGSKKYFGESILAKVWDNLQEISEIKTQMRQERIKHFRAKFAAPVQSLQRAQRVDDTDSLPQTSKQARVKEYEHQAAFDMNQEIFPIPAGGQVPQYIQRDLEIITKASDMIKDCLSEIAFTVGAPRSIFNLDEKGTIHVETEKKKDRRYMRHIFQAQRKLEWITEQTIQTYWRWKHGKELEGLRVSLDSPFEMTVEEKVDHFRKMNPDANFISQEEAVVRLFPEMDEDERQEMLAKIKEESSLPIGSLNTPVQLDV